MNRPVRKDEDSHGNTPDSCPVVLLLVDVLNDLDFPDNSQMLQSIDPLGKNISVLKKRCKDSGIPAIYVNDNRDKWRSDFSVVLSTASELYVRDLGVYVPSDCVATPIKRAHRYALELMKISFDADTTSSTKLNLWRILKSA